MTLPLRLKYGISAGALIMSVIGFVQWLRLQLQLGSHYQAADAGVPYQNIDLNAAHAVNRLSNEWLAVAFAGVLLSGWLLARAIRLTAPNAEARVFWGGGDRGDSQG